jgi:FixJ family two-component response regulator
MMREPDMSSPRPVVVVIDDDAAVLGSLRFALEIEGFEVETYGSAREFLARESRTEPVCLVIDYRLPDMNGLDLLMAMRRAGDARAAVLITSNPGALLRRRAADEGVPIIEKPLLSDSLLNAIRGSSLPQPPAAHS